LKRLAAIFLLLVVVFNIYGYRFVLSCLQQNHDAIVEAKIDQREYSEAELISIKTTLHLPYYTSSREFERAYGSININGIDYEYVKRRVHNDTLELLCLPNQGKTKLQKASNELAKAAADDNATVPLKKTMKISLPDFFQSLPTEMEKGFVVVRRTYHLSSTRYSTSDYSLPQERPPQVNA
jgi:hypothetical protein